jgi:hypothetical protein
MIMMLMYDCLIRPIIIELNYLSHGVLRLFEDPSRAMDDPNRFYVNVLFSPGAGLDPFIFKQDGHILPGMYISP